jgi:hypothetical protein
MFRSPGSAVRTRKTWMEAREDELFEVSAELDEKGEWNFWEKEAYRRRWYPCPATTDHLRKAMSLLHA